MRIIKRFFLALAAILIVLAVCLFGYFFTYPKCSPTKYVGQSIILPVNSNAGMISLWDLNTINIVNQQPITVKALSKTSFSLIINQETYLSLQTNPEFNISDRYLKIDIASGNHIVKIDNLSDTEIHFTSDASFSVTIFPNSYQKILSGTPTAGVIVFGLFLIAKIVKKFKKLKPTT